MGLFSKLVDKLKNGGDNDSATPSSSSEKDFLIKDGVLVKYTGKAADVTIPEGVTTIGNEAFKECKKLKSVTIPQGVTTIGNKAFYNCTGLTSVTIPEGVTKIGERAFTICEKLAEVTIPKGITSIEKSVFSGCKSLTSITIPEGVTSISSGAFGDCENLTSVTIPEGVTSIGERAFAHCEKLTDVKLPTSIRYVEFEVFSSNIHFNEFGNSRYLGNDENPYMVLVHSGKYSDTFEIHPQTVVIASWAFKDSYVTKVSIPDSVKSICKDAFLKCDRLQTVRIGTGVSYIGGFEDSSMNMVVYDGTIEQWCGITFGSRGACYSVLGSINGICPDLYINNELVTDLVIPDSVTSISPGAFAGVRSLKTVKLPEGLTAIGTWTFFGCFGLEEVSIPDSVTEIGQDAFGGCQSLESIKIPENVTLIDAEAFMKCTGLTVVTLPASLKKIGDGAFVGCDGLEDVFYKGKAFQWVEVSIGMRNDPLKNAKIHNV